MPPQRIADVVGAQAVDPRVQLQLGEAHDLGQDSEVLRHDIEHSIGGRRSTRCCRARRSEAICAHETVISGGALALAGMPRR